MEIEQTLEGMIEVAITRPTETAMKLFLNDVNIYLLL
jgi:hypothetical protein